MKLQPRIRSKDILKIVIPTPRKNILFALISFFFIFSYAFTPSSSRFLSNLFLYKIILRTPSAETNNPIIKAAYISLHKQFPFLYFRLISRILEGCKFVFKINILTFDETNIVINYNS